MVRVIVVLPTWDGPEKHVRDIPCELETGEVVLRSLPERGIVRVAIGFLEEGVFTPIAHSPALETTPSRGLVRWTLAGPTPIVLDDPRAASIARAAEAAARVAG